MLSGTGGLTVNNTGIVTLGGANLFSGGVNLNAGGLVQCRCTGQRQPDRGWQRLALDTTAGFTLGNNLVINGGAR